jgi:hypothetical protein
VAKKKRVQKKHSRKAWLVFQRLTEHWRLAIFKLRDQLYEDCLSNPAARRHFQNRRLIQNLHAEFESSANKTRSAVLAYYTFSSAPWDPDLGYTEALRQHYAELKALGISPEFERPQFKTEPKSAAYTVELLFRLDSLASWTEAQESWVFWRALVSEPAAWDRHDDKARLQAIDARLIARLPVGFDGVSDWLVADLIASFRKWPKRDWVKILKMASRIAERSEQPVSELDRWVWWRYPVFMRYHWSAAEVCRAAQRKFGPTNLLRDAAAFQSAWVRRGLRFRGKKTSQKYPFLWDFVINEQVPKNVPKQFPILIPYENSSPRA